MSRAPHSGMLVHGDVRLVRRLCDGGMGSVWVAEHRKLRTEVAVKLMAPRFADDAVARARFDREATSASRVRSPHVVQILDFGVSSHGHPFIVMELLEGRDLKTRLQDAGALPAREVASITRQLCHALGRAHACGIVHRDLKPSNVYLCDSPRESLVKLLDFGIAKDAETPSPLSTTAAVGTPFYMSPQQLTGDAPVDYRSDLWALGVLVFEMLTGKRPFEGTTTGALALAICSAALPSPRSLAASLPASVDAWFARACARDPRERFDSAEGAARALELALGATAESVPLEESLAATFTETEHPQVVRRWGSRKSPVPLAAVGVALLVPLVTSVAMSRSSHGLEESAPPSSVADGVAGGVSPSASAPSVLLTSAMYDAKPGRTSELPPSDDTKTSATFTRPPSSRAPTASPLPRHSLSNRPNPTVPPSSPLASTPLSSPPAPSTSPSVADARAISPLSIPLDRK